MFDQYLFLLTAVLGVVSATLTGVIAHIKAPSQVKAVILLLLSLVSGAIVQGVQANGHFTWHGFLTASVLAFTAGVVAHKSSIIAFITGPGGLVEKYVPAGLAGSVDSVIDAKTGITQDIAAEPVADPPVIKPGISGDPIVPGK